MQLSELNETIDTLKSERDAVHDELHALLDDKSITVQEREDREREIRARIVEYNAKLWPLEMERAEITRMVQGKPRKSKTRWIAEDVTLG